MIEVSQLTKVYGLRDAEAAGLVERNRADAEARRAAVRSAGGFLGADDVSFEVRRGEVFVVMGLSGSGKSTVLRMLNRLIEPTAGRISVGGQAIRDMDASALRELRNRTVGMVFQHFGLFEHRSVRENAAYGLRVRKAAKAEQLSRADAALAQVGLQDRGDARPSELSGGQRQRVGLARALATESEVLLMDEPFSALDPLIRREMQELLLSLQAEQRRTIVFVTHDLVEALRLGTRIMIMRDGRVVQSGTGEEILSHPADDYVAAFVADLRADGTGHGA
ncbi:ATP-binding cassette domain-containing protein [Actinoplanes sp. TRM 88003]|uniref:ATP-binding cassette domain-containing protein n=1 Tax=Paractinoplanes aksuensis TaxID=2939490 RepID=A0ABT1E3G9_9ACTN|nr:ATP-binding cassette domain-containing protein [Actinoplanes aksuensis]MCO8277669.1 ATP-binding cassette domain-containing protein [Actinoplanes aksuensis]